MHLACQELNAPQINKYFNNLYTYSKKTNKTKNILVEGELHSNEATLHQTGSKVSND